ncbi:hypothetical protein LINGRAHAP2_LOCUS35573 [Linum grandiflorum]
MARSGDLFRANFFSAGGMDAGNPDGVFEFDESDVVWSGDSANNYRSKSRANNRRSAAMATSIPQVPTSASLPVNIPDWSKIYKEDRYGEQRRRRAAADISLSELGDHLEDDSDCEEEWSGGGGGGDWEERVPPHEYLARRRGASLSVHEGVGRTLKGRDLRQVRNAIWKKVGFED